jgi:hypothetical protein
MKIIVYKIKDTLTGLYSTGGSKPKWTKKGKTWSAKNHVTCSLSQGFISDSKYQKEYKNDIPSSWVIVTLDSENGVTEENARSLWPETKYI